MQRGFGPGLQNQLNIGTKKTVLVYAFWTNEPEQDRLFEVGMNILWFQQIERVKDPPRFPPRSNPGPEVAQNQKLTHVVGSNYTFTFVDTTGIWREELQPNQLQPGTVFRIAKMEHPQSSLTTASAYQHPRRKAGRLADFKFSMAPSICVLPEQLTLTPPVFGGKKDRLDVFVLTLTSTAVVNA